MTSSLDLRLLLPEARDQGTRPTCLSLAISDGHSVLRADGQLLSTDFLHFHAARRLGLGMNDSVNLSAIRDALREDGQPPDGLCPYAVPRESAWEPPNGLSPRLGWLTRLGTSSVADSLDAALDEKRASVVSLNLTRSFYYPDRRTNEVVDDDGPDVVSHAVLVVGKRVDTDARRFLVRNSWGYDWGDAGHAWLSDAYLNRRGVAVVSFEVGGSIP